MANKKPQSESKSKTLTKKFFKEFLGEQLQSFEKRFDAKIEYVHRDTREHIQGVADGLNKKIDSLDLKFTQRIGVVDKKIDTVYDLLDKKIDTVHDSLNMKIDTVHDSLNLKIEALQSDVKGIDKRLGRVETKLDAVAEKVERHDEEIVFIKSALSRE